MKNNILIKQNKSKCSADFSFNNIRGKCLVGFSGVGKKQVEGDGFTPIGTYELLEVFYRKDKVNTIYSVKKCNQITRKSGWSIDPDDKRYNKFVSLPYEMLHEEMFRMDRAYDVIITTSFNSFPTKANRGSAIFIHCIDLAKYTQGCVAMPKNTLLKIVTLLKKNSKIIIS